MQFMEKRRRINKGLVISCNKINKIEENTDKLEKKVSSGHSLNIILVELFCGIIGVIMLVISNKTTE